MQTDRPKSHTEKIPNELYHIKQSSKILVVLEEGLGGIDPLLSFLGLKEKVKKDMGDYFFQGRFFLGLREVTFPPNSYKPFLDL